MTIVLDILTAIGALTVFAFLSLLVWAFVCRNRPPAPDPIAAQQTEILRLRRRCTLLDGNWQRCRHDRDIIFAALTEREPAGSVK